MWNNDLKQIQSRFETIGKSYQEAAKKSRQERQLPKGLLETLAKEGLFKSAIQYQGKDGIPFAAAALEGLCCGILDGGTGVSLTSHLGLCVGIIAKYAQFPVKEQYLEGILQGKSLVSFAVTEPQGGSDVQHVTCLLTPVSNGYRLNGEKWSITNAPLAALFIVICKEEKTDHPVCVLVDPQWQGVDRSHALKPAGLRSSPTGRILFQNVNIPKSHILGNVGDGFKIFNEAFDRERLLTPFGLIGIMERLLDETFAYAQKRIVFEKPIGEFQYIRKRLTDMKVHLEITRCLAHRALEKYIQGQEASLEISMAKFYAANSAADVICEAIKIFGSHRFEENDLDECLMSALAGTIAGGTEEVHREVIYQSLYRQYRRKNKKRISE